MEAQLTLMINSWLRLWGEATLTRPPQPMPMLGLSGAWLYSLSLVPQGTGITRLRSSHPCQVSILGTTVCYLGLVAFGIRCISIWRQICMRGWKKNSILSLFLVPNLCERMEKNSILSLHIGTKFAWEDGKIFPSSHSSWHQIFMRGWKKNPSSYLATLHVANLDLGIT